MSIFKRHKLQGQFYRDYVKSTFWQLRRRRFLSRQGGGCQICTDTDRVDVYHLRPGDYGHERDEDLVALCREHYIEFQKTIDEQGDFFDRTAFIREKTLEHQAAEDIKENEKEEDPMEHYSPSFFASVHLVLNMLARPIWRMIGGLRG